MQNKGSHIIKLLRDNIVEFVKFLYCNYSKKIKEDSFSLLVYTQGLYYYLDVQSMQT